jgi:hypothetical protein
MFKDKDKNKLNIFSRWVGDEQKSYIIILILICILIITGIILYKTLHNTRIELESCRSSISES